MEFAQARHLLQVGRGVEDFQQKLKAFIFVSFQNLKTKKTDDCACKKIRRL